jgi:hypothetical protein
VDDSGDCSRWSVASVCVDKDGKFSCSSINFLVLFSKIVADFASIGGVTAKEKENENDEFHD